VRAGDLERAAARRPANIEASPKISQATSPRASRLTSSVIRPNWWPASSRRFAVTKVVMAWATASKRLQPGTDSDCISSSRSTAKMTCCVGVGCCKGGGVVGGRRCTHARQEQGRLMLWLHREPLATPSQCSEAHQLWPVEEGARGARHRGLRRRWAKRWRVWRVSGRSLAVSVAIKHSGD